MSQGHVDGEHVAPLRYERSPVTCVIRNEELISATLYAIYKQHSESAMFTPPPPLNCPTTETVGQAENDDDEGVIDCWDLIVSVIFKGDGAKEDGSWL